MIIIELAWLIIKIYIALLIAPVILWVCIGVLFVVYHLFVMMIRALISIPIRFGTLHH